MLVRSGRKTYISIYYNSDPRLAPLAFLVIEKVAKSARFAEKATPLILLCPVQQKNPRVHLGTRLRLTAGVLSCNSMNIFNFEARAS